MLSHSIENLRKLSDRQLIEEHDKLALNTVVGTQYYQNERGRRSHERSQKAAAELALRS